MQTLFIIGNKRSGTSQLVRLLNLHPKIFVSHESDIAWILYQFHQGKPFAAHPWDSPRGMQTTLDIAGHLLNEQATPQQNFAALQSYLMEKGTPWLPAQHKTEVQWMGDKKPLQNTDPQVLAFILKHFPEARFVHIVRHPLAVVASSDKFNQTADGDFWLGMSPAQKLERWTFHEQQVVKLRETFPGRVHTLRFEDLCRRTAREMARLFSFLQVKHDHRTLREAARQTFPLARPMPLIPCSDETMRMGEAYGYNLKRPPSWLRVRTEVLYWRLAKLMGA